MDKYEILERADALADAVINQSARIHFNKAAENECYQLGDVLQQFYSENEQELTEIMRALLDREMSVYNDFHDHLIDVAEGAIKRYAELGWSVVEVRYLKEGE